MRNMGIGHEVPLRLTTAADETNVAQRQVMAAKVSAHFGGRTARLPPLHRRSDPAGRKAALQAKSPSRRRWQPWWQPFDPHGAQAAEGLEKTAGVLPFPWDPGYTPRGWIDEPGAEVAFVLRVPHRFALIALLPAWPKSRPLSIVTLKVK